MKLHFRPIPGLLLLVMATTLAVAIAPVGCSAPEMPTPANYSQSLRVDDFIDPKLPAYDRQVMKRIMSGLAAWQTNKVIFYDVAGSGRIFANSEDLLAKAFYYKPVPGLP